VRAEQAGFRSKLTSFSDNERRCLTICLQAANLMSRPYKLDSPQPSFYAPSIRTKLCNILLLWDGMITSSPSSSAVLCR